MKKHPYVIVSEVKGHGIVNCMFFLKDMALVRDGPPDNGGPTYLIDLKTGQQITARGTVRSFLEGIRRQQELATKTEATMYVPPKEC